MRTAGLSSSGPGKSEILSFRFAIPFFLYGVALGDLVATDENYTFLRVLQHAHHAVFRVWFGDSVYSKDDIENGVRELGGLIEWSSENLMAADALDPTTAAQVFDYLQTHHDQEHLKVEIGKWVAAKEGSEDRTLG
jgi:hypothetical protein